MKKIVEVDIVIVGGGVAGLWLLNRLRQKGFSAILVESVALGDGQTNKSQGIIHGGMKYALQGTMTAAAQAIAEMPTRWQKCLSGQGEIDLTHVPILSPHQYLWANSRLTAKIAGFFANMALKGKVELLSPEAYPAIFQHPAFKGAVYSLDEMVIDVHALIRELVKPNQDVIFKINPMQEEQLKINAQGGLDLLEVQTATSELVQIKAKKYIFTAGSGNEILQKKLAQGDIATQRRPLHMVLVKVPHTYPLYAHCLGLSMVPRMTITTHTTQHGDAIWYLGGQIAEDGVTRDPVAQVDVARKELTALFPWLDFSSAEFATFRVDRSEPLQPDGQRPDSGYVKEIDNVMVAWPTKLALAPQLADDIIKILQDAHIKPGALDIREVRAWPIPALAKAIWDQLL